MNESVVEQKKDECCLKCFDEGVSQLSYGGCSNAQCDCHAIVATGEHTPSGTTEEKNKGGRPTKYDETIVPKTLKYIEESEDEEYDWTKSTSSGKVDSESWEHRIRVKLPTIEGLALYLDVNRDTIFEWREVHKEFSDSLKKLLHKQQQMLIAKGLSGDYNPTIAKLILSANHGMKEKTETDITSGGEKIGGFNFIRNDTDNHANNKTN